MFCSEGALTVLAEIGAKDVISGEIGQLLFFACASDLL